ncbi:MAG: hypothetical protein NZM43_00975 [Saprospiraceae bacterium]|nr:hypothetical protein [Saprospiraceae bacterium]MDW8482871.1 hypothetical protein [Saprospiraceae bacterium]
MTRLFFATLLVSTALLSCQPSETPVWKAFKACSSANCLSEALAVRDAFCKNPQKLLEDFSRSQKVGDQHFAKWLQLLRDSAITNPSVGTYEERLAWRDEVLKAAQPYAQDAVIGEAARAVIEVLESVVFMEEEMTEVPLSNHEVVFTGTYTFDKGQAGVSTLAVRETEENTLHFRLTFSGKTSSRHQEGIRGEATLISRNEARYVQHTSGNEYVLLMRWLGDDVEVITEKGNAVALGWESSAMTDGVYARQSYKDPFLDASEARRAALLEGDWISANDPKTLIRIKDGRIYQLYNGEELEPPARCLYFPQCPPSCSPAIGAPCLKIIAQDEVCYTILKADSKTLEISRVDGENHINRYLRKKK